MMAATVLFAWQVSALPQLRQTIRVCVTRCAIYNRNGKAYNLAILPKTLKQYDIVGHFKVAEASKWRLCLAGHLRWLCSIWRHGARENAPNGAWWPQ